MKQLPWSLGVRLSLIRSTFLRASHLQGEQTTAAGLHVRSALMVAVGRCMAWNGGSEAPAITKLLAASALEEVLVSVAPTSLPYL